MRSILRALVAGMAGSALVLAAGGCGDNNEGAMAGTKGVAPADAPKSQAEFFKQQQELSKAAAAKAPARKSR